MISWTRTIRSQRLLNQIKSTSLSEKRCSSWPACCKRAAWLAAASLCARLFLWHFSDRSSWIMHERVLREIPSSVEIWRLERCDWGRSSWLWTSSSTASTVSVVRTAQDRPLPGARSIEPVARSLCRKSSKQHLLWFLFGNLLSNRLVPYCFDSHKFLIRILSYFVIIFS